MELSQSNTPASVANDVLHNDHPTKLSAEEIAKALAHHNRRHAGDHPQNTPAKTQAKTAPGKK
jgi:hypothetical protein